MHSDFETAADIIKTIDFNYNGDFAEQKRMLFSKWGTFVGERLAKYSEPVDLTEDGVMLIKCENSVVANELFIKKNEINILLKREAKNTGQIPFKYIKITYGK